MDYHRLSVSVTSHLFVLLDTDYPETLCLYYHAVCSTQKRNDASPACAFTKEPLLIYDMHLKYTFHLQHKHSCFAFMSVLRPADEGVLTWVLKISLSVQRGQRQTCNPLAFVHKRSQQHHKYKRCVTLCVVECAWMFICSCVTPL